MSDRRDRDVSPRVQERKEYRGSQRLESDDRQPNQADGSNNDDKRSSHHQRRNRHDDDNEGDRHSKRRQMKHDKSDESDDDNVDVTLPYGATKISNDDFFLKSNEFRIWLDEKKGKRLDSLKSSDARYYFSKFVKRWNRNELSSTMYKGIDSSQTHSNINTTYNWKFKNATQRELDDASRIRKQIGFEKQNLIRRDQDFVGPTIPSSSSSSLMRGTIQGPSLPDGGAVEALHQSRDSARDDKTSAREDERRELKRQRRNEREEERDNRATGKDRLIEKRKEKADSHRAMRDAKDAGGAMQEFDDDTLMGSGGGDSFQAALAARDRARTNGRRAREQEERQAAQRDKLSAMKAKEHDTMAQLRELAAARFGAAAPPS
ncbi:hypothetical protein OIO90_003829 [Microbotryomycetes sp. JL221]|nr:hypothetical protein OIO90_003829 [Microbotryomycetes sp. JL221]